MVTLWAWAAEAGYQLPKLFLRPWLRVGYFAGSGDDNAADGLHKTFFQMIPTGRPYAQFPFFNQMNNEDLFLQAILKPAKKLAVRTDLHFLRLYEEGDRWYMGAGPTSAGGNIFGYHGRPSYGDRKLGTLLDITMAYNLTSYLSAVLYYGHVFGGDVIENIYPQEKNANFGYIEITLAF